VRGVCAAAARAGQDRRGGCGARERARRQVAVSRSWHRSDHWRGYRCRSAHNVFGGGRCAKMQRRRRRAMRLLRPVSGRCWCCRRGDLRCACRSRGSRCVQAVPTILAELETVRFSRPQRLQFTTSWPLLPFALIPALRSWTLPDPASYGNKTAVALSGGAGRYQRDRGSRSSTMTWTASQCASPKPNGPPRAPAGRIVETPEQDRLIRWQQRHEGPLGHLVLHATPKLSATPPEAARHSLP